MTLLIADSSLVICNEIVTFCENYADIDVLATVHNGKDAIDIIQEQPVDVILMDIVLPVLDGLSVINQIYEMEGPQKPAIFVHTAFLDNSLLQELQKMEVRYCFVKPMGPEHIVPRILQLMRASGQLQPELPSYPPLKPVNSNGMQTPTCEQLEKEITRQIRAIGVPAHLRGYHYLRCAIQFSVEAKKPSTIAVTKDIYPYIAKQFNTRPALVERSIRNAIEVAWTRGNTKVLHQFFGYTIDDFKGKPTNAEFIAMIADRVRIQMTYS